MLTIIKIYRECKLAQKRSFFKKKRTHTHNLNPNILFFIVKGKKHAYAFKSSCSTINTKLVRLGMEWVGAEGTPLFCLKNPEVLGWTNL